MPRAMSIQHIEVDKAVLRHLRERIKRRKAMGYTDVPISIVWMEQFLEIAEKEVSRHA